MEPIRCTLQEWSQPSLTFNDLVVEAVAREQEDVEVTVAITKKCERL